MTMTAGAMWLNETFAAFDEGITLAFGSPQVYHLDDFGIRSVIRLPMIPAIVPVMIPPRTSLGK